MIVKLGARTTRLAVIAVGLACLAAAWFSLKWNFANMLASQLAPDKPEARIVGDWLSTTSPADPRTHSAAGAAFERSFDIADVGRARSEYEAAASLSPHDYVVWLNVSRVRGLSGDRGGMILAMDRALQLAPSYAAVQWAYGNALIRQGRLDEGLAFLAKASAGNTEYSRPTALTALQMLDGDIDAARRSLGDGEAMKAALVDALASLKRFDEAVGLWAAIAPERRTTTFAKLGSALLRQLVAAKRFGPAARVAADLWSTDDRPALGNITNAGFESDVRLRDAGIFEWQIADGAQPVIGLAEGQAFEGAKNLFLLFNSFETAAFRPVAQTVAVEPGREYELALHYRSDIKSAATFKFEAASACDLTVVASTAPMTPSADWATLSMLINVPPGCDGIVIRLNRDGCTGPACSVSGKLSVDGFSLKQL